MSLCRTCLTEDATKGIRNTKFQQLYEKLSNTKLITEDRKPESVCETCFSLLRRCHSFSVMSQKADQMLTQLYSDGVEISQDAIAALHRTRDTLGAKKPAQDSYIDVPIKELSICVDVPVKEELDPVKVEAFQFEQSYVKEDMKIEDKPLENDSSKKRNRSVKPIKTKKESTITSVKLSGCDRCEAFSLKPNIKSHLKTDIGDNRSTYCRCISTGVSQFEKHVTTQTVEKPYVCNQSDKNILSDNDNLKKTEKSYFFCTECNASFAQKNSLRIHMRQHRTKKPYSCGQCYKIFEHNTNLKKHLKIHIGEKLTACDRCGKTFPNGYQLKRHMRCHTGEKPYACDHCHRKYSDRSNLKKHIVIHSGEKSFICTECNAPFNQKSNLLRHMRSHTGEMPFFCDICQKSYPDASLLKRHTRIHTGEKPFVCDVCGKAFSDKDNFKTHLRLHSGEKPYACKLCDYKSAHGNCLKLHLARKHKLNI